MHLKLQKYSLAIFYFSKALKFLEKTLNGQPATVFEKENPNDFISNLSAQKTPEILYNYGIVSPFIIKYIKALFKSNRLEEAFRCFEKASPALKHHPRVNFFQKSHSGYSSGTTWVSALFKSTRRSGRRRSGVSAAQKRPRLTAPRRSSTSSSPGAAPPAILSRCRAKASTEGSS